MTTQKRALLYVRRNQKRSILLFLLLTVLMTISLLGLALYSASTDAVRELRRSIGGYCTIHTGASGKVHTDEALLDNVKSLDNVRTYNGVDTYYMYMEGISLVPACWHGTGTIGEFAPKFIACTSSSLHERFVSSSFQLTEGRHILPEDRQKAIISREVAQLNHLTIGDQITGEIVEGVRDWIGLAGGMRMTYEIVGIYTATRSEVIDPSAPESELQENIVFTDIDSARQLYRSKFPDKVEKEYYYSSGIMLFLNDPAKMGETVERMKQQDDINWDELLIYENSAAYQQAAAPIQRAAAISKALLFIILVISIALLSLTLLMWTRERMKEIGILISIGLSPETIWKQILAENCMISVPAFAVSLFIGVITTNQTSRISGGILQDVYISGAQAFVVLICAAAVIFIASTLAAFSILKKRPKEILTSLS